MHVFVDEVGVWIGRLTFGNFQVVCELFVAKLARKDRLENQQGWKFPCLSLKQHLGYSKEGLTVERGACLPIDGSITFMESLWGSELFKHAHESEVVLNVSNILRIKYCILKEVLR